jgi:ATP-binding cassette subfamily B protein
MNYGAFTVTEAIAFGDTKSKISAKRAREAAQASQADDFINRFPLKYKQILGKAFDNGVSPSTGQWQKIALARVFYRNPNVFILDEPTASIDADAEAKIFEKMESLSNDKTVIFISHRFSTVRNANKIIVIKEGVLAEEGTHSELLKNKKLYAELFRLQAKGYQ